MSTLTQTVSNIVGYSVTETQAKNYALNNYGILATYIRNEYLSKLNFTAKKNKKVFGTVSKKFNK